MYMRSVIMMGVALMLSAQPLSGQDRAQMRSDLVNTILVSGRAHDAWERFRSLPGADSALISVADDPSCNDLLRRRAQTYLARLSTPVANARIIQTIQGNLNPSTDFATATLLGLSVRPDSLAMVWLERALREGDLRAQEAALHTLGRIPSARATELIRSVLGHPSPNISAVAARLLNNRANNETQPRH